MSMNERLALAVYALVENSPFDIGYEEACHMMGLSADETTAVLEMIDADLSFV